MYDTSYKSCIDKFEKLGLFKDDEHFSFIFMDIDQQFEL